MRSVRSIALVLPFALTAAVLAVPPDAEKDKKKSTAPEAEAAAKAAGLPAGLTATVWAAEPLLANPVAFAFDERGRCFVAETHRMHDGVIDTRGYMHMLDDDIGCRTVADRLRKYQTHKLKDYSGFAEQLRIVWDSTGSGQADKSDVFAGGFNKPEDGVASGVLARKGTVYFTCIPDLYAFGADPDKSKATNTKSLGTGFGIRDQFIGHDLHGLRMGPDGKLYFSIGDRGFTVKTKEGKTLSNPDSGAVLRCDPDGSNMEIVHVGLRNPQELAFDDFGNLFTYDNNSDSGDQARWVQIVEGGDSGWRCGYQYGTLMHTPAVPQGNRGPWNTEKIWQVPGADGGPPAYVVPPLKNFGNGPSGLTHYPGVGLSDKYKDHFFACDFTASASNSKVWALAVKPKGASFEVVDLHPFVTNAVPTDCEFGPDGAFYWLDWIGGWNKTGKGRIFRVTDPEAMKNPAVEEARKLLADGFEKRSVEELAKLLGHPHQQVRLEAQYELAGRKQTDALAAFAKVLKESKDRVAKLHAVWGAGMTVRLKDKPNGGMGSVFGAARVADESTIGPVLSAVVPFATDTDAEVRVAVAKVLGDHTPVAVGGGIRAPLGEMNAAKAALVKLVADTDPRVRSHAVVAYARAGDQQFHTLPVAEQTFHAPIFDLVKTNGDQDAYLRHAGVIALTKVPNGDPYFAWKAAGAKYDTPAVRLAVVLALRRLQSPKLAEFLIDADPKVVAEAARAIHDQELTGPMADLAKLLDKPALPEPVAFRAVSANFKLGQPEHAARLAEYAGRTSEPDYLRAMAVQLLAEWVKPSRRDAVTGCRQELDARPAKPAADVLRPLVPKLLAGPDAVRAQTVKAVIALHMTEVADQMAAIVADDTRSPGTRAESLLALAEMADQKIDKKDPTAVEAHAALVAKLKTVTTTALESKESRVRAAARVVAAKADPTAAAVSLPKLLDDPLAPLVEKQFALAALGDMKESKGADEALAKWLDKLIAGTVPDELMLDVMEAAETRATAKSLKLHAPLREKLKEYDGKVRGAAHGDMGKRFPDARAGGDPEKGKRIFVENLAVYCQRCHKMDGQGGEVGPALDSIGATKSRDYLIEAIVVPNKEIAQGYQSVILNTTDGKTLSGVLRSKDKKQYMLVTPDNKVLTVPTEDVESEKPDKSAMPDDLYKKLSRRELRDLVAYLAGRTAPPAPMGK